MFQRQYVARSLSPPHPTPLFVSAVCYVAPFPPPLHLHLRPVPQLVYCIMSHVAIAAHMMVLKEYGGVTAVLVGNTRKSMTIALSFFLFPKVREHRDSLVCPRKGEVLQSAPFRQVGRHPRMRASRG